MVGSVIFSQNGASHMNDRATLSNGWTVKENGGGTVYAFFGTSLSLCVYIIISQSFLLSKNRAYQEVTILPFTF
jgi:hypothetical protein